MRAICPGIYVGIILLLVSDFVLAASACDEHLVHGTPSQSDQILCRDGYALGYSYSRKTADWVAYRLTPGIHDDGNVPRQNDFRPDDDLPLIYRTT